MRRALLSLAILLALLAVGAGGASIGRGITLGAYGNVARFDRLTGQRTDSGLVYLGWDQGRSWGSPYSSFLGSLGRRPHIMLKTTRGSAEAITPRGIAQGQGDAHLIGLAQAIAASGKPVIVRPLGEMNNDRNAYCAFSPGGARRDAAHSTAWYRKAFQRIYLVMHGGTAANLSAKLQRLGLPGVAQDVPVSPYPQLTIVWNPLAIGIPAGRGNHYKNYNPGLRYFDAYGNDYYDTSGVYAFHRTIELYKAYPSKPFVIPEWGLTLDDPGFVRAFAAFVRAHGRTRFVSFYNGPAGGPYDLGRKPKSLAAYRRFIAPLSR